MKEKVVIVGRPNVGKSTLFNRLIGHKKALVHDLPGVTRDLIEGLWDLDGYTLTLVDTGGLFIGAQSPISKKVLDQAMKALKSAKVVLFVVDAKDGLLAEDWNVARELRENSREVVLCVNKVDNPTDQELVYEFYQLGFERVVPISAEHGLGIQDLEETVLKILKYTGSGQKEEHIEEKVPLIAILGRPNVGKSSLVNRIIGYERMIVSEVPGTTRDSVDLRIRYKGCDYVLIDTAGIRKKSRIQERLEKISTYKSWDSLKRCDIALIVLDASSGVTDQDVKIAGEADSLYKASIIVLNKWDLIKGTQAQKDVISQAVYRFGFMSYSPIVALSAKTGEGIPKLFRHINMVIKEYNTRVETPRLNRILGTILTTHNPPKSMGKAFKFYYATQAEVAPPTVVGFVNYPELATNSYIRFIVNKLRENFPFTHSPIKLVFKKRN